MMELKKYKLKDLATVDISSVDKKTNEGEKPVRLCNFTDVYKNWAITSYHYPSLMRATAKEKDIEKFSIHKGQVAITKDSETRDDIGIPTYIADDFDDVVLGYHCALITPGEFLDGKYLNAYLNSKMAKKYFEGYASGSGQRYTLTLDSINDIQIWVPSISNQKKISKILSDLDKKIKLNQRINVELEAMAKQLYDYWFVQFDFPDENGNPYKSSGGKMVYNSTLKREIPEGWEICELGDFCNLYQPQTIGTDEMTANGEYRVYGANGRIGYYTSYNHKESEIIMACRGNSCGIINRSMPFSWITGNAMVLSLKDKTINNEFIAQSIRYMNIKGVITGSGQPQITRENLSPVKMIKPHYKIVLSFSAIMDSIVRKKLFIESNNDYLTHFRDSLLPMLMNGQVTVE